MRIAHLSDPHVNLKFHPQHLPRLRRVLEHALGQESVDHIVITGDLTSNADARDLLTVRRLFESLGILKSSKLTVVIGNHDVFGGPHLAGDLFGFPDKCRKLAYDEKVSIFQDTFAELFTDTITMDTSGYPFLKKLNTVCLLGLNSIARHSLLQNPVGSNGEIGSEAHRQAMDLAHHHAWRKAGTRIALLHHHTFRPKDVAHLELADAISRNGIAARIEQRTLKLHGKRALFKLFKAIEVDFVMHGHIHFTGNYPRESIPCSNGGGAVYPIFRGRGFYYNLIELEGKEQSCTAIRVENKANKRLSETKLTGPSRFDDISEMFVR